MKKLTVLAGLTVAAASAVLLTGCHADFMGTTSGSDVTHVSHSAAPAIATPSASTPATPTPAPTATRVAAPPVSSTSGSSSSGSSSSGTPSSSVATKKMAPAGRPPQPAAPTRSSNTVPGLTAAIAKAPHVGMGVCGSAFSSVIAAAGDIRGIGATQYLVDTTCQGATGSSPDEVAIYQSVAGVMTRTVVLYQPTAGAPLLTSYPYLDGPHTVVLAYNYGTEYRLDTIGASSVVVGPIRKS